MKTPRSVRDRALRAFLVLGLCAGAWPSAGGAAAQEADPLVADSIAALGELVSKANCQALDAADADPANGFGLPYVHCNDGVPPSGGGEAGIPVPVKYKANEAGDDWSGLPL